jgi:hypothetical protein
MENGFRREETGGRETVRRVLHAKAQVRAEGGLDEGVKREKWMHSKVTQKVETTELDDGLNVGYERGGSWEEAQALTW